MPGSAFPGMTFDLSPKRNVYESLPILFSMDIPPNNANIIPR